MIKRLSLFVLIALFAAGMSIAFAQDEKRPSTPNEDRNATVNQQPSDVEGAFSGTVEKIRTIDKKIIVRNQVSNETRQYDYADTTSFLKDGHSIRPQDIKQGDHVTIVKDSGGAITKVTVDTSWKKDNEKSPKY